MLLRAFCWLQCRLSSQRGSSMVEWMVLGVLIVVGLFGTIGALKTVLKDQYCTIIHTISASATCG